MTETENLDFVWQETDKQKVLTFSLEEDDKLPAVPADRLSV